MHETEFDGFTRAAAASRSRRSSLLALSGAMLAGGLIGPMGAEAKSSAKKVKRRNKRRCEEAQAGCRAIALGVENPDLISQAALACCHHCFSLEWLACVDATLAAL